MEEDSPPKLPVVSLSRYPVDKLTATTPVKTPVKKRAGRLAAEPQLDLIQENATVNSPRSKRRSVDEKPVTPARRSTRIRSNTSLVVETPQTFESPRAKRAARRSSIAGSDTESNVSITSTRRSRKNSKTEETQVEISGKPTKDFEVCDVILEESDQQKSPKASQESPTTISRRSPRLANKGKSDNSLVDIEKPNVDHNSVSKPKNQPSKHDNSQEDSKKNEETEIKVEDKDSLSMEQIMSLVKEDLNKMENKVKICLNKSLPTTKSPNHNNKKNRSRTKSWTGMMCDIENVNFLSDNESVKKNVKKGKEIKLNKTVEEIDSNNTIFNEKSNSSEFFENSKVSKLNTPTKNTTLNNKTNDTTNFDTSIKVNVNEEDPLTNIQSSFSSKQDGNQDNLKYDETSKLVPDNQVYNVNVAVVIEKPNSNIDSNCEEKTNYQMNNEDQCVPVVHKDSSPSPTRNDDSCEPMDIDESIPKNTSLLDNVTNKSFENKSTLKDNIYGINVSSLVYSPRNNAEQGYNNSVTNTSKSQKQQEHVEKNKSQVNLSKMNENDNTEFSQKSIDVPDSTEDKENMKSLTGTPLINKMSQKYGLQTSTPVVSDIKVNLNKQESKKKNIKSKSKKNIEALEQDDSETDEESKEYQNSLIDDEANEASENYESGDSLDDEDRMYMDENEIIEKGETLTSDEEFSNDSEYEKDSFVVTSDEDDNELLSGSGDDLSMSDGELTMSAKSKKKFNARKLKEQKRASREMYESRHKINESNDSNKQRKYKRQRLETESDENIKPIKGNRLRLESSSDAIAKTTSDDVTKKKETRKLSESFDKSAPIEKEITQVLSEGTVNTVDPLCLDDNETCTEKMDIEEVEIEMIKSIVVKNESVDPLRATDAMDSSDDSMSSENEEIKQNYDAMLSNLNNQKKFSHNISLNLNKKDKNKSIDPIINQLNLTGTRKINKSVDKEERIPKEETSHKDVVNNSKRDSSDSIDLQLLFSDSSNDSDAKNMKSKKSDAIDFIPLRSSVSKTDVQKESGNTIDTNELSLNKSGRKSEMKQNRSATKETFTSASDEDSDSSPVEVLYKSDKKRQSIVDDSETATSSIEEFSLNISKKLNKKTSSESPVSLNFLGFPSTELDNVSLGNSSIKDNMKNTSILLEDSMVESTHDTSLGASKKKKNDSISILDKETVTESCSDISQNNSMRKKKKSESFVDDATVTESHLDISQNNSMRKKKTSESFVDDATVTESLLDISQNNSMRKKKKSESFVDDAAVTESHLDISQNNSMRKKKKSESFVDDAAVTESHLDISQNNSMRKKKKSESFVDDAIVAESHFDISQNNSTRKKKKSESFVDDAAVTESHLDIFQNNSMRKKKKSESFVDDATVTESLLDISQNNSMRKKKKSESFVDDAAVTESHLDISQNNSMRKKKKSESFVDDATVAESHFDISQNNSTRKKKKSESFVDDAAVTESHLDISQNNSMRKKKKSESFVDDATVAESHFDISQNNSMRKKKKSKSFVDDAIVAESHFDISQNNSTRKKKKSESFVDDAAVTESHLDISQNNSMRKKKKSESFVDDAIVAESHFDISQNNSTRKKKKSESFVDDATVTEFHFDVSQNNSKKKKKKNSESSVTDATVAESLDISQSNSKKKRSESSVDDAIVADSYFDISQDNSKKKKNKPELSVDDGLLDVVKPNAEMGLTKKQKKKYTSESSVDDKVLKEIECLDKNKKKKSKIISEKTTQDSDNIESITDDSNSDVSKKHKNKFKIQPLDDRIKKLLIEDTPQDAGPSNINDFSGNKNRKKHKNTRIEDSAGIEEPKQTYDKTQNENDVQMEHSSETKIKKSKKRKQRDEDIDNTKSMAIKTSKTTELPQLSSATLDKLKTRAEMKVSTSKVVSTTNFVVEESRKRKRVNPSSYLEESVCLNVSPVKKKMKSQIVKPKVLPSVPTALSSGSGFTTRFYVNVIPKKTEFVTQPSDTTNFKRDTLIKRKRVTKNSLYHLNLAKF